MTHSESRQAGNQRPVLGVVLAGGRSRRFRGTDKAFQTLAGRPLLEWVVELALPQVAELVISANGDPARFAQIGPTPVIADVETGREGPLAGVEAAIKWLQSAKLGLDWVATFPVDGPFAPGDLVSRLLEEAMEREAPVVASSGGRAHPTFGVWPVAVAGALELYLSRTRRESLMAFIESLNGMAMEFGACSPDPFFNINSPDDLALAQRMMGK